IKLEYDLQQVQRGYLLSSLENHLWAYVKVNHPDSVEILDALARGYMHSVRLERACATFDELLKRRPDDVQALLLRGRLRLHKSNLQEAAADFRRILDELDPNNDEARRNLAKILVDFSQFPEAFPLYQGLAKQHPDDPEVAALRCELGKLMLSIGSDREGLILLRGALDVDPADQDAHRALSDYFRSKGRLDLAAEHDLAVKNTASRQP